jgi:hypothetical protein
MVEIIFMEDIVIMLTLQQQIKRYGVLDNSSVP